MARKVDQKLIQDTRFDLDKYERTAEGDDSDDERAKEDSQGIVKIKRTGPTAHLTRKKNTTLWTDALDAKHGNKEKPNDSNNSSKTLISNKYKSTMPEIIEENRPDKQSSSVSFSPRTMFIGQTSSDDKDRVGIFSSSTKHSSL